MFFGIYFNSQNKFTRIANILKGMGRMALESGHIDKGMVFRGHIVFYIFEEQNI